MITTTTAPADRFTELFDTMCELMIDASTCQQQRRQFQRAVTAGNTKVQEQILKTMAIYIGMARTQASMND